MATEETVGTIVQKLALDMKEFETSVKKAEGISKALKASMSDLGTLTVDPSGKLSKTLDDYTVKTGSATQSTREFFREQRMQDRIFKESVQSITGAVFALSLFTQGNDKAASTTKTVTQSLLAGVGAANAAEFAFFGVGKSMSNLPGTVGRLGASLSSLAGPIGMIVGVVAAIAAAFFEMSENSKKADTALQDQKKAVDELTEAYRNLESAVKGTDVQNTVFAAQERDLTKKRIDRIKEYLDITEKGEKVTLRVMGINQETRSKTAGWEARVEREFVDVVSRMRTEGKTAEQQLDELKVKYDALSLLVNTSTVTGLRDKDTKSKKDEGPRTYVWGVDKPAYIDQEYESGLRAFEKEMQRREKFESDLAALRASIEDRIARAREASWQRDVSAVENLGSVMQSTFQFAGDSFLGKMVKALQIATQIARALRFAGTEEGSGLGGILGVVSSFIPGLGLLFGASTGTGPRTSEAVNRAYAPSSGGSSNGIRVSGSVDLSNGKLFLIQEMPGYSRHLANKTV